MFFRIRSPFVLIAILMSSLFALGQVPNDPNRPGVRTVSIPISIFTKQELKEDRLQEYVQLDRLIVRENGDEQQVLSIRTIEDAPLSLAVLIQDDLGSEFNLQLSEIKRFITTLPRGSRVMVAYLRGGSAQIRQRFTSDLEQAARSLRIVVSSNTAAPRSPFDGVVDILNRFDALPAGRRAVLLVSDGVDLSSGLSSAAPGQGIDLDKAILRAQRKSVAVFSIFSPSSSNPNENSTLTLFGQGSLQKLSDETGGRAFFQGSMAPISFVPFFKDLSILLSRQFLLTYLSTHMKKGYYKVQVSSTNPEIKIEHPRGYYHR
jgi:VWFA-related protein